MGLVKNLKYYRRRPFEPRASHELLPTDQNDKEWVRNNGLPAGVLEDPDDISDARRLVASVYLENKYINPEDIDNSGFMVDKIDPFVEDSQYFGYKNKTGRLIATGRLIKLPKATYPALIEFGVRYEELLTMGLSSDPKDYAEISALAKLREEGQDFGIPESEKEDDKDAILHVYAQMFRSAIESGKKYFLMSVDIRLTNRLWKLFGRKNFIEIAEPKEYMGSKTVPMAMNIGEALKLLDKHIPRYIKSVFIENLKGLDASRIDPEYQDVLYRHNIIEDKPDYNKKDSNFGKNATALGAVGLAALSVGKYGAAIDVAGVQEGATYAAVDLSTIPPYAYAMKGLIEGGTFSTTKSKVLLGTLATSIAAPYVYLASQIDEVPAEKPLTLMALASAAFLGLGMAGRKIYNNRKSKK